MIGDLDYLYEYGTGLEVPGVEATFEYGDASAYQRGRIPGALLINDHSKPDQVRVTDISGLHDDPDSTDSRIERAGHFGERAGLLIPRGRTVGLTGSVRSNNVPRMRDLWRRTRAQFGRVEQDLIIHPPGEAPFFINEVFSAVATGWIATSTNGGTLGSITTFTDGLLAGLSLTNTYASPAAGDFAIGGATLGPLMRPWNGEDVWMTAVVRAHAAAAAAVAIKLGVIALYYDPKNLSALSAEIVQMTGAGVVTSPATGTYYTLAGRLTPATSPMLHANYVMPYIAMTNPATSGVYTLRIGRAAMVLLNASDPSPAGFVDGALPGYEWEDAANQSRSYGPCYAVNQFSDPDCVATTATWVNDSTSGVTVDTAGAVISGWPEMGRSAISWAIHNPNTTSRTLAVRYPATLTDPGRFIVASGRSYRAHLRLRVAESFATGVATIVWTDISGAILSTSTVDTFDPVAPGGAVQDVDVDGIVTAPAFAVRAHMRIASLTASTTANNRLNILISEPRFLDISEYDPGAGAAIDSTVEPEKGVITQSTTRSGPLFRFTPTGARRRIPRPFLLRKARAIWDGKAPESQRNLLARRDFTMSLRSSDPRVYVLDERHARLQLSGAPTLVSYPLSTFSATIDRAPATQAADSFVGTTAGSALNGRTSAVGGYVWATSGDTTDLVFADLFAIGDTIESIKRSTAVVETTGRNAILGSTNFTDSQLDARLHVEAQVGIEQSLTLRWADASNYVRLVVPDKQASTGTVLRLEQRLAGTTTTLASDATFDRDSETPIGGKRYRARIAAYSTGRVIGMVFADDGTVLSRLVGTSSALATGGALATGKPGLNDKSLQSGTAANRYMTEVVFSVPAPDPRGAPTSFTYEGESIDPDVRWKTNTLGGPYPLSGTTLGPSEDAPPASGYLAQASLARMYYSAGALTYTTPQVTVSGNCIGVGGPGKDYDLFMDSLIGGAWQYNYIGALLKRVSSTTWIEARYNSANQAAMNAAHASPTAPFSLELWCSHDTSGTLTTTRLGGWDIPTSVVNDGARKHLRTYMDSSNVAYVELWASDPGLDDEGLVTRQSFTLSSALITLLGQTVAGRTGMMARLGRWDDGTHTGISADEMEINYESPYISTFDAVDFNSAMFLVNCPVIGDVDDVPVQLVLRGGIDTPTISLASAQTGRAVALRLSGVFTEDDPVTIDMDAGTIRSASGADYFDRRLTGSRFFSLAPGQNVIGIQAVGWDSAAPAHVIATWRDALK